jgi:hypothetical protein
MSTLNLNTLLESLEAQTALEKTASQQEVIAPAVSDEFASLLSKKSEQDLTKEAQAQGEALARMLLEKAANEIQVNDAKVQAVDETKVVPTVEGTIQDSLVATVEQGLDRGAITDDVVDQIQDGSVKQAEEKGNEMSDNTTLAQYIMQKLAEDASGEGSVGGAAPNNIIQNDAVNQAFDEMKEQDLPNPEGSVNGIFEAIVARAKAQGGGTDDLVVGGGSLPAERNDNVEKAAAVQALVAEGCDFEDAVSLVKQAEEELNAEAYDQEKQAAFSKLVEAGVDFDSAVELIKQAEEDLEKEAGKLDAIKGAGKAFIKSVKGDAKVAGPQIKGLITGKDLQGKAISRAAMGRAVSKNKVTLAAGGATLAAAGQVHRSLDNEKKAAFETLSAQGVDFESAVALINQAEQDIYG